MAGEEPVIRQAMRDETLGAIRFRCVAIGALKIPALLLGASASKK